MPQGKTESLARVLCDRGAYASFAEAKRAAMRGHIKVNGKPVNDVMVLVKTGDEISVHNKWERRIDLG